MTADDGPFKVFGNNTKPANLGINLSNEEFSGSTYLLLFCFDLRSHNCVTEDYALGVKLNTTPHVRLHLVNGDELLAVSDHLSERHCWPCVFHFPAPPRPS